MVFKMNIKEVKLAKFEMRASTGQTMFNSNIALHDENQLWNSLKLIVTSTARENTEKKTLILP